ncbi:hypothetical protein C8Q77DRAFT_221511 [Trametes polyzona]|nr:hypothetical protein C8Q77DRAFT_221511 [Trametes polyzona]
MAFMHNQAIELARTNNVPTPTVRRPQERHPSPPLGADSTPYEPLPPARAVASTLPTLSESPRHGGHVVQPDSIDGHFRFLGVHVSDKGSPLSVTLPHSPAQYPQIHAPPPHDATSLLSPISLNGLFPNGLREGDGHLQDVDENRVDAPEWVRRAHPQHQAKQYPPCTVRCSYDASTRYFLVLITPPASVAHHRPPGLHPSGPLGAPQNTRDSTEQVAVVSWWRRHSFNPRAIVSRGATHGCPRHLGSILSIPIIRLHLPPE